VSPAAHFNPVLRGGVSFDYLKEGIAYDDYP